MRVVSSSARLLFFRLFAVGGVLCVCLSRGSVWNLCGIMSEELFETFDETNSTVLGKIPRSEVHKKGTRSSVCDHSNSFQGCSIAPCTSSYSTALVNCYCRSECQTRISKEGNGICPALNISNQEKSMCPWSFSPSFIAYSLLQVSSCSCSRPEGGTEH